MSRDDRPAFLRVYDEVGHALIRGWNLFEISGLRARARVNSHVGLMELWVTVMKPDGKGGEKPCYEQPKILENQGVIVLIEDDQGRFVFVQNYRQVGKRVPGVPATRYVNALCADPQLIERSFAQLGEWGWELPQGTVTSADPRYESLSERELIFEIARIEAREEAGCELTELRFVGWLHTQSTYIPFPWAVVHGRMESQGEQAPEENEFIGRVERLTPAQIRERIDEGSLGCASMLGALLMAGIPIPPSR